MPIKILMPALSPTMTEGNLAKWHVKEGDAVNSGDILAEIETDKATMEVEAVEEGTVGRIVIPEGSAGVAVNQVIALLLEEGEGADDLADVALDAPQTPPAAAGDGAEDAPPAAAPPPAQPPPGAPVPAANGEGRVFASPLARRMAEQAGLDLAALAGSGPHGRVVKRDVDGALADSAITGAAPAAAMPAEAAPAVPAAPKPVARPAMPPVLPEVPLEPEFDLQPLTPMRKTIAERLVFSKQTIPHFYLTVECAIDRLLEARRRVNEDAGGAYKLSVNDLIVKACGVALQRVPAANASYTEDGIKLYKRADVAVAVAIDGGLITPVIRDAGNKGLEVISYEVRDLAERARAGKLMPEDYQGGTFSISNLGMYGIKQFDAVIDPPQGAILAVGAGEQRPVAKDGELAVATVMSCTLSCDHRVVDGAIGAQFLAAFKAMIEEPLTMLL